MSSSNTRSSSSSSASVGYGYSVTVSYDGGYMFGSDIFSSKTRAQQFLDFLKKCDPARFNFEMYSQKPISDICHFDPQYILSEQPPAELEQLDLSHMTLSKYGKGYLLTTSEDDDYFGRKNLLGGWWMPKHRGWFFKTGQAYSLLEHGVIEMEGVTDSNGDYIHDDESDYSVVTISDEFEKSDSDTPYAELTKYKYCFKKYGRGYMLTPFKSHKYHGQKYLGDGFWNASQKGWFFQSRYFQDLLDSGFEMSQ